METLHLFGTKAQRSEFLEPLRKGELRSAFVMTEPGVGLFFLTDVSPSHKTHGGGEVLACEATLFLSLSLCFYLR